jgi:hypothetical protein
MSRKKIEDNGEKAEIYFYRQSLLLFCVACSVCKINIKLISSPFSCQSAKPLRIYMTSCVSTEQE